MTRYHRQQHVKKHRALLVKKQLRPKLVDRLVYIAAIVEPLATVPQVYAIFRTHNATSISISTWLAFELMTFIWLWYGIAHRERAIVVYQGLFAVLQAVIITGACLYGGTF